MPNDPTSTDQIDHSQIVEAVARLDRQHITEAANAAVALLQSHGVARIHLAPGDMTHYRFLVAVPGTEWRHDGYGTGRDYWVALVNGFGAGDLWSGQEVHPGYAAEKWAGRGLDAWQRIYVGHVVALFLSALAKAIARLEANA